MIHPQILVVGALLLDIMVDAPHLPRPDETVHGGDVRYAMGGKGGNQALAASRMGARVEMMSMVGRDDFAKHLTQALDRGGVGRTQVMAVDGPSGMNIAICRPDGSYGAVAVTGANAKLRAERVAFPRDCKAILLQNEVDEGINIYLARRAQATRIKVVLNASPARETSPELLRLCDLLIVNRGEAADMLRLSEDRMDAVQAAISLAEHGPKAVVVSLGEDGLALFDGEAAQLQAAFSVAAKSTIGAGDILTGALVAEWMRGQSLAEAAAFGLAASAMAVAAYPEARSGQTEAQVRAFLKTRRVAAFASRAALP